MTRPRTAAARAAHRDALLAAAAEQLQSHIWQGSTHPEGCWQWHAGCLAAEIRVALGDGAK